ncbi:unnamed protein product [Nesidiocoris tenuis]|uniref:Uncharacterized protein n=1 Tax=Nesidiocoris tenuis TaxID=355587 RepID=A0A6H5GY11_9HEMI|nr:unnamed protein product [Nesidiocoris tenuis]
MAIPGLLQSSVNLSGIVPFGRRTSRCEKSADPVTVSRVDVSPFPFGRSTRIGNRFFHEKLFSNQHQWCADTQYVHTLSRFPLRRIGRGQRMEMPRHLYGMPTGQP